jgi:hypothetical protein
MPEHTVAYRDSGEMLQNAVPNITRAGTNLFPQVVAPSAQRFPRS